LLKARLLYFYLIDIIYSLLFFYQLFLCRFHSLFFRRTYVLCEQRGTTFSELQRQAEPIPACSKVNPSKEKDLLVISSGYDYQLILKVAKAKKACQTKCQIFGFPSLQPDMYQEIGWLLIKQRNK